jgi:hypothetical protein
MVLSRLAVQVIGLGLIAFSAGCTERAPASVPADAALTAEDRLGSLEAGKLADLVVLALPDLMALERDPDLAFGMRERVLFTMVDGRIRHEHPGSPWK